MRGDDKMRIFEDPDEYIELQDWARKVVKEVGDAGAEKLKKGIDRTMEEQRALPSRSRRAFDIDKLEGMSAMLTIALNESRVKDFMALKHSQDQRRIRAKRRMYHGDTREKISERDQKIIEDFKRTRLTSSSFAEKHAAEYHLSSRWIRRILKKAVGT
jgi:hypothetical protein